ncbi:phytanoyl-CoA dioxygenase [Aureococcus anophagefferens]|nr:phytanoyl-CoA dioxygenase [Aureococcus anophagefferens]
MMEAFLARVRGVPDEDETGSDASSGASDLPESFDWTTAAPRLPVCADLRAATLCRDQGDDGCALEDPKLLCVAQDGDAPALHSIATTWLRGLGDLATSPRAGDAFAREKFMTPADGLLVVGAVRVRGRDGRWVRAHAKLTRPTWSADGLDLGPSLQLFRAGGGAAGRVLLGGCRAAEKPRDAGLYPLSIDHPDMDRAVEFGCGDERERARWARAIRAAVERHIVDCAAGLRSSIAAAREDDLDVEKLEDDDGLGGDDELDEPPSLLGWLRAPAAPPDDAAGLVAWVRAAAPPAAGGRRRPLATVAALAARLRGSQDDRVVVAARTASSSRAPCSSGWT